MTTLQISLECLIAFGLSFSGGLFIGLTLRWLKDHIGILASLIGDLQKRKADTPVAKTDSSTASLIDPDDLQTRLRYERDRERELLNK